MKKSLFESIHKCVICKGDIEVKRTIDGTGHNAWPVTKGNCCYKCEEKKVIPRRKLKALFNN